MFVAAAVSPAGAQSLEALAQRYRKEPSAANRAALLKYAKANKGESGGLALLVAGLVRAEKGASAEAAADLKAARERLSLLRDYAALPLASTYFALKDFEKAREEAGRVLAHQPPSPLAGSAVMIAARSEFERGRAEAAERLLAGNGSVLGSAPGRLLLAQCLEANRRLAQAAAEYQRVRAEFPLSPEAATATAALARLEAALGPDYPVETGGAILGRIQRLMDARQHAAARKELLAAIPRLGGAERDAARVRLGVNAYLDGRTREAYDYLRGLEVSSPEPGAERLYYLLACARRLNLTGEMAAFQRELAARHATSPWRLEALIAEGNHHLLANRVPEYVAAFKACYESFPEGERSDYCHWKVTWAEYLGRRPGASAMLREHLRMYPGSEKAASALYFLGRLAEEAREWGAAHAYHGKAAEISPNSYYAVLARERLARPPIAGAKPDPAATAFLAGVRFPARGPWESFDPAPSTRQRIQRARLLASAGLEEQARGELRFGARNEGQGHVLAVELARLESAAGAVDRAIRGIKSLAPDYLYMPPEAAPESFWKLAFPLAFRDELVARSRQRSLDPLLVAALIRQESEFNPRAVSRAKAYGLTQVLPGTGRALSRKVGIPRFTTSMLYRPDVNLKLGTYYMRSLLDQFDGREELMLAAYNAGKSRVVEWLTWGTYREPAEFIETIPFTETRGYVQAVLRNADVYRRLYAGREFASTASGRP